MEKVCGYCECFSSLPLHPQWGECDQCKLAARYENYPCQTAYVSSGTVVEDIHGSPTCPGWEPSEEYLADQEEEWKEEYMEGGVSYGQAAKKAHDRRESP